MREREEQIKVSVSAVKVMVLGVDFGRPNRSLFHMDSNRAHFSTVFLFYFIRIIEAILRLSSPSATRFHFRIYFQFLTPPLKFITASAKIS